MAAAHTPRKLSGRERWRYFPLLSAAIPIVSGGLSKKRATAALQHPNLVVTYAAGSQEGVFYVAIGIAGTIALNSPGDAPSHDTRLRQEWRYASPAADLRRSIRGRTIRAPP